VLIGLRNPWRFWFDVTLNEVWIGDVGQDHVEEIDRLQIELDEPPKNLGWPRYEGEVELGDRDISGGHLEAPVITYTHEAGHCSVTGGLIYRGTRIAAMRGRYVFGDFCSGAMWSVRPSPGGAVEDLRREKASVPQLTHIGTDSRGELVMTTGDGKVVRAIP
jgi:glucose/arabinose dehydrogenase